MDGITKWGGWIPLPPEPVKPEDIEEGRWS